MNNTANNDRPATGRRIITTEFKYTEEFLLKDNSILPRNSSFTMKKTVRDTSDKKPTSQELEIMNIFTSHEWSNKSVKRPNIVNIATNQSASSDKIESSVINDQEKYSMGENKNKTNAGDSHHKTLQSVSKDEQDTENNTTENAEKSEEEKDFKNGATENSFDEIVNEQEFRQTVGPPFIYNNYEDMSFEDLLDLRTLTKNTVIIDQLRLFDENAIEETNENIHETVENSYFSEAFESSSGRLSLNTSEMARIIRQKKSHDQISKKKISDDKLALDEGLRLIHEETIQSLGQFLLDGLFYVSKTCRHDPFRCLSQWLLIQADLRDQK
ncbi:Hypothetical protein CINCED_3A022485 [Cinara cedri]|uniref:Uncharacterized protein n=1 Tax=Cinara cedri TaxID=506608 RepID=A0A5E4M046_9HEMI|nr:Hypothetical protein CINCED_3A022485 [Cinara cedri]